MKTEILAAILQEYPFALIVLSVFAVVAFFFFLNQPRLRSGVHFLGFLPFLEPTYKEPGRENCWESHQHTLLSQPNFNSNNSQSVMF